MEGGDQQDPKVQQHEDISAQPQDIQQEEQCVSAVQCDEKANEDQQDQVQEVENSSAASSHQGENNEANGQKSTATTNCNESYPILFRFLLKQQISLNLPLNIKIPDTFQECEKIEDIVKFIITNVFERQMDDSLPPIDQLQQITGSSDSPELLEKIVHQLRLCPLFDESFSNSNDNSPAAESQGAECEDEPDAVTTDSEKKEPVSEEVQQMQSQSSQNQEPEENLQSECSGQQHASAVQDQADTQHTATNSEEDQADETVQHADDKQNKDAPEGVPQEKIQEKADEAAHDESCRNDTAPNIALSVSDNDSPKQNYAQPNGQQKQPLPPLKTGEIELTNEETRKLKPDAARLSVSGANSQSGSDQPGNLVASQENNGDNIYNQQVNSPSSSSTEKITPSQKAEPHITQSEYEYLLNENETLKKQILSLQLELTETKKLLLCDNFDDLSRRRAMQEQLAKQKASDEEFLSYFKSRRQEQQQVVNNLDIEIRQEREGNKVQRTMQQAERARQVAKSDVHARSKADPFGLDQLKARADQLMKEADMKLSQRASGVSCK